MIKRTCLTVSRIKKGFTQKEVAKMIGLSQQVYSKYESGKTTPSSFKIMNSLAEILGKPKELLFGDIFNKKGCEECGVCNANS